MRRLPEFHHLSLKNAIASGIAYTLKLYPDIPKYKRNYIINVLTEEIFHFLRHYNIERLKNRIRDRLSDIFE